MVIIIGGLSPPLEALTFARLRTIFFSFNKKHSSHAKSKAKIDFINNNTSKVKNLPFFWAGAILTGKVDTIKSNQGLPGIKYIGAAILLLAIADVIRKALRAAG